MCFPLYEHSYFFEILSGLIQINYHTLPELYLALNHLFLQMSIHAVVYRQLYFHNSQA